ncbi:hypothetical protein [Pedobacter sp. GR22-6]
MNLVIGCCLLVIGIVTPQKPLKYALLIASILVISYTFFRP